MKKKPEKPNADDMRAEYDPALIRAGVRGKYARRYKAGAQWVPLAPDVAKAFPSTEAVNEALRLLLRAARLPKTRAS
jgi:hypothetical protein